MHLKIPIINHGSKFRKKKIQVAVTAFHFVKQILYQQWLSDPNLIQVFPFLSSDSIFTVKHRFTAWKFELVMQLADTGIRSSSNLLSIQIPRCKRKRRQVFARGGVSSLTLGTLIDVQVDGDVPHRRLNDHRHGFDRFTDAPATLSKNRHTDTTHTI
jgi:hypothetical protein